MVAVAYRRWSFTRDSHCKSLTREVLVFWIVGRLREVVAHGGSTVFTSKTERKYYNKENLLEARVYDLKIRLYICTVLTFIP